MSVELQKETTQNFKYENFYVPCFCLVEEQGESTMGPHRRD